MPRLLIASTVPSFLEAFLLPYVRHFRARGWRVDGMAAEITSSSDSVEAFDRVWDIHWSRNPLDPSNLFRAARQVERVVTAESYDIVHVHTPVAAFVCRYALRKQQIPRIVYTAHGFHFHEHGAKAKNLLFLGLEKLAGRWTDHLVVINEADEQAASQRRLVRADRIVHMPGIGLDTLNVYNPRLITDSDIARIRSSFNLTADDPVFLMLAEFIPRKRHADILHAFARLNRRNAHLLLAGSGPLLPRMRELANTLSLADRVHFLGIRKDVPALIRSSSAVVLCSEQEGLPRSVMEALALEVPVIGASIRGTRQLLEGGAGRLYKVGDVDALCAAMEWVLDNPDEAAATARIGRERLTSYDIRNLISQHEELYARALGRERVRSIGVGASSCPTGHAVRANDTSTP